MTSTATDNFRRLICGATLSFLLILPYPTQALQPPSETELLQSSLSTEALSSYRSAIGTDQIANLNRFDIFVALDPRDSSISGRVDMRFKNTSASTLSEVVLRLWPNSMGKGEQRMKLTEVRYKHEPVGFANVSASIAKVKLPMPLRPGETISLEAGFTADIPQISGEQLNLYAQAVEQMFQMINGSGSKPSASDYGVFATDGKVFNLGGFYPVPATLGTGGWEAEESNGIGDFSFGPPSNYFVAIRTPSGYTVAAPGREIKSFQSGTDVTRFFVAGGARDFVIEASSTFETAHETAEGTEITAYYQPEQGDGGKRMMQIAKDSFIFYSKKFGAYPFKELKVVAAPITGGAGGVEFPGLVTIAGMLMQPPPRDTGKKDGMDFGSMAASAPLMAEVLDFVVAHEVAHQWWSSLVGSDPRKYPYVDESMASYSAVLYFEEIYGKEKGRHILETQVRINYLMMRLFGGDDRPIETPVSEYNSMMDYAGIVYGKAPLYQHALRGLLGVKAYMEACKEYTRKFGFRVASPKSLSETASALFTQHSDRIAAIDRRWLTETHGDEDIGKADLGAVIEAVTGKKIDGNMKEFLEEMFPMMKEYK